MIKLNCKTLLVKACTSILIYLTGVLALPAQGTKRPAPISTFTSIYNFCSQTNCADGELPYAGLIQSSNGKLYGTTASGGANAVYGTVFSVTPNGTLTTVHSFDLTDGGLPDAPVVQGTNGDLYGTTPNGGANGNYGTVFKITRSGALTTLHSFDETDGFASGAGLIQASNGNFYGTTFYGGPSGACTFGCGTIFKISPNGNLTTLHNFDGTDGAYPWWLVQDANGDFYGTTNGGGAYSGGTVFKITPSGTLTMLHSFDYTTGLYPYAGLVRAKDGNFYGTTYNGGANEQCLQGCGTVFQITQSGTLTTIYNFCSQGGSSCSDGVFPYAGLVQGTDGDLYGTTPYGGNINSCEEGCGTVFQITPGGTLTTLHTFGDTDGKTPYATLLQDTNGTFYGTTHYGGLGAGTVFSVSVGLAPFVATNPTSATLGMVVRILGTNLTGATNVTFNGTAATFTVVSGSEITTTVPTGATTGTVQVVTPGGTLSSNVPFRVTQ